MDKVSLLGINNEKFDVAVIRFFSLNVNNYFIYSMNEVDEQNYIKLYAVKINIDTNGISSSNIIDENEWLAVKEMIKTIIKENKEGSLTVVDADYHKLENVKIGESRVFKLSAPLVELLKANKKNFTPTPEVSMAVDNVVNANIAPNVDPIAATFTQPMNTIEPTMAQPMNNYVEPVVAQPVNNLIDPMMAQTMNNAMPEVDYQSMYLAEKANNERLHSEIEALKNKISVIKDML